MAEDRWLLLLHQIPAKPDYLRVKVWRRLQRIGAFAVKNAAWVLPRDTAAMEDFQWLIREIEGDGGDALLCEARFIRGLTPDQAAALRQQTTRRVDAVSAGRTVPSARGPFGLPAGEAERGRTWITRRDVYVDRIASAWLIRRHIDPEATFRFVSDDYMPDDDEIRFDMYDAEYTHIGDSCTFEVLASIFTAGDTSMAAIAEIVHDIDLKESRFRRAETAGVQLLVDGIVAAEPDDHARLERGFRLFDDLLAGLRMHR